MLYLHSITIDRGITSVWYSHNCSMCSKAIHQFTCITIFNMCTTSTVQCSVLTDVIFPQPYYWQINCGLFGTNSSLYMYYTAFKGTSRVPAALRATWTILPIKGCYIGHGKQRGSLLKVEILHSEPWLSPLLAHNIHSKTYLRTENFATFQIILMGWQCTNI